jgi:hypothetical protein
MSKKVEDRVRTVRISALLLARKMIELEKEDAMYLWDEIITYLRQRECDQNKMEYKKLLSSGGSNEQTRP